MSAPPPNATNSRVLRLRTDGAARGNPGPAGLGMVIEAEDGTRLWAGYSFAGEMTNNRAEYLALIAGLQKATTFHPDRLEVCLDSQLVVEQLNGRYKIKNRQLQELAVRARQLLNELPGTTLRYVPRAENAAADALANRALDEARSKAK
ncbi:MAG: ribonuclease HI family protein [Candidatus Dormiibacterota bacterium]